MSALYVRFRDVEPIWEVLLQVLFYASPIIYPIQFLPPWSVRIAFLNPFVQVMQDIRAVLLPGTEVITAQTTLASAGGRGTPIAITVLTLVVALYLFRRESPWFAERV